MTQRENEAPVPQKQPYEPPAIVAEEVFETLALTCGKADDQNFECFTGGGVSS